MKIYPDRLKVIQAYTREFFFSRGIMDIFNKKLSPLVQMITGADKSREILDLDAYGIVSKIMSQGLSGEFTPLERRKFAREKAQEIASYLSSIPRTYKLHFTLPSAVSVAPFSIQIAPHIELRTEQVTRPVRLGLGLGLSREPYEQETVLAACLVIDAVGYVSPYGESSTTSDVLSLAKQCSYLFTHFGVMQTGVLGHEPRVTIQDGVNHELLITRTPVITQLSRMTLDDSIVEFGGLNPSVPLAAALEPVQRFFSHSGSPDIARVATAMEWWFDSTNTGDQTSAYLMACIGLESLLGDEENMSEMTKRLCDRYSYLLGNDRTDRARLAADFSAVFKVRGHLVHARQPRLKGQNLADLRKAQGMLDKVLGKELRPYTA